VAATRAVARYVCWLDEQFTQAGVPGDMARLLAAGYDTGSKSVIQHQGPAPEAVTFANEVVAYAHEYGT
jgi:hypothetical protein